MTKPVINWEISVGTIIHAVILLSGMAVAYGSFTTKFEEMNRTVSATQRQTTRIEHYISSEDKDYWQKVARNGDGGER